MNITDEQANAIARARNPEFIALDADEIDRRLHVWIAKNTNAMTVSESDSWSVEGGQLWIEFFMRGGRNKEAADQAAEILADFPEYFPA